jgi:hypothetical protein
MPRQADPNVPQPDPGIPQYYSGESLDRIAALYGLERREIYDILDDVIYGTEGQFLRQSRHPRLESDESLRERILVATLTRPVPKFEVRCSIEPGNRISAKASPLRQSIWDHLLEDAQ